MAETGSTSYWVVIDGKNFKTGKPLASERYGPYASQEEAELAEADLIPWGDSGDHVHRIHIEAEPGTQGTG